MINDKATVVAHYDDTGRCRCVYVYLSDARVTAEDVAAAVAAVYRPGPYAGSPWPEVTRGNGKGTQLHISDSNNKPGWF